MTVAELKRSVALLGFEDSLAALDDTAESHFWHAVNRSLWTVNRLRPKKGVYLLCHFPPCNLLSGEHHFHRGGTPLAFCASGAKAYTFSVCGTGSCTVKDGERTTVLSWTEAENRRFCGFLSGGEVSLSFTGDFDYPILSLALWDTIASGKKENIPVGGEAVLYDLPSLISDFLRLDETPFLGQAPKSVIVQTPSQISISRKERGCFSLCYRPKWQELNENTEDDYVLPLDEDLCQLLPQLVASEICLDADEEKATYYQRLYQERARELKGEYTPHTPVVFRSSNRW